MDGGYAETIRRTLTERVNLSAIRLAASFVVRRFYIL